MKKISFAVGFLILVFAGQVLAAIELPDPTTDPSTTGGVPVSIQYGDFYSYSLPILQYLYHGDNLTSGDEFYVKSTPGDLWSDENHDGAVEHIVIASDVVSDKFNAPWAYPVLSGGNPHTATIITPASMDNAYETPSGSGGTEGASYFRTGDTTSHTEPAVSAPDANPQFSGDTTSTWDARLSSLAEFLGSNSPIFFFNNNETGSGEPENTYVWGQIRIVDTATSGTLTPLLFDFAFSGQTFFNPIMLPNGVYSYSSPGLGSSLYPPTVSGLYPEQGNFVTAGGEVTLPNGTTFDHNLGANNAAYAIYSPELDAVLKGFNIIGSPYYGYDALQADIRMYGLNNGGEQLFLMAGTIGKTPPPPPPTIPEPASLFLLGSGLVGILGATRLRKKD